MAVIWKKTIDSDQYEVRTAGSSVRLYSNGVFHSHYNPNHALSNSIWDLLLLPVLFQELGTVKRILVMGVGGGTVIKLFHKYLTPEKIIGVEINPTHVKIAKKYFKISRKEADLICADAIQWIKAYKGPAFDMIIDDMFGHANGDINRAVALDGLWFKTLNQNLSKHGVLVINTTEKETLKTCAYFTNQRVSRMFEVVYRLEHPKCDNFIGVFFKDLRLKKHLTQNIRLLPDKKLRSALLSMDYKINRIG